MQTLIPLCTDSDRLALNLMSGFAPRARFVCGAVAGVPPRIMGIGLAPASKNALAKAGLSIGDMDVVELNEAFASQAFASMRELGLADEVEHVNRQRRRHCARA